MSRDQYAPVPWARWVSPDHWVGQALLALRSRADLMAWRPRDAADRTLKEVVARVSPTYTMVGVPRLRRLAAHAALLHAEAIPGAVVECGTWRGGSLALVDWVFRMRGDPRPLWGFDSFEGLPPPGDRDPAPAHRGFFQGWCTASPDDVREAIRAAGGSPDRVQLVAGWLDRTLTRTETGRIALLNVDVDWYESVTTVFEELFDRMSPGGIISVDDYGRWGGCDRAVHAFLDRRGLPDSILNRTGRHGAWLRVPGR
jgi:O-methyltransferase